MAAESKPPVQPVHGKQEEWDRLLEPDNLKLAKYLRDGGEVKPPIDRILTLEPSYAAKIHDQVITWLKEGDFESLAQSLESDSLLLSHGIVYRQIQYLRRLLFMWTEEDLAEGACGFPVEQEKPLPIETKRAARAILERLVRAWVKGILPQYVVEPVKHRKRRGAPGTDDDTRVYWLMEFNNMREELLTQEGADAAAVAPKRGETRMRFIRRLARLVQKVYAASVSSLTSDNHRKGKPMRVDPFERPLRRVAPLPDKVALAIAEQAIAKNMRVAKNKILYGLVAQLRFKHWTRVTKARRLIERAEKDFPDYNERRPQDH